jgi:hypothetical protein
VTVTDDTRRALVRDQLLAKRQRKSLHLSETATQAFEVETAMTPDAFIGRVKSLPLAEAAAWLARHPSLGEILDRNDGAGAEPIFLSNHKDKLLAAQTKANLVVDRAALDDPDLIVKREGGGFDRLDRLFAGQLEQVLDAFNDALWNQPAA